jgi:hypothetical protein
VLAALGEVVWSEPVVGLVECAIDGTVVCALDSGTVVCALDDGTVVCALDDGTVVCALNDVTVVCALNDGTVVCALNDGTVIFALDDVLSLCLVLEADFVDTLGTAEVSAVVGDMI